MKKLVTTVCTVAALAAAANASFAANAVRINQVFGSNSATNAYAADFIELFNASASPVSIGGWTIQYGSATTTTGFGSTSVFQLPAGATIPACGYYLIQLATVTAGSLPVAPDASSAAVNLSGSSGKIALTNVAPQALPCLGSSYSPPTGSIIDAVGYGTGAGLCWEGAAAAPGLGGFLVLQRGTGGMTDTDQNAADFATATVVANQVVMHNSASPASTFCLAVPATNSTWGRLKSIYR